jgi:EVE domain
MSNGKCWIGVASANHVARGKVGGFMQVNHGKEAPLKRLHAGDVIAYYSPVKVFGGKESLKAFTAIGLVKAGGPYLGEMGGGMKAFRRDVEWRQSVDAAILPLLSILSFTRDKTSWGYQFRFGLFEIPASDMAVIAQAMGAGDLSL